MSVASKFRRLIVLAAIVMLFAATGCASMRDYFVPPTAGSGLAGTCSIGGG